MGTRAIVHIREEGKESPILTTIYRQFDGYPEGLGLDIQSALKGKTVVNGYSDPKTQVNGMGCAAAMLIAEIKEGCGNVYIKAAGTSDVWEEYAYQLYCVGDRIHMTASETYGDGRELFDGPLDDFDPEAITEAA